MAFVFSCPSCASTLRTGAAPDPGRPVQCPHCRHLFTSADTTVREEHFETFPTPAAPRETLPSETPRESERPSTRRREEDRTRRRYEEDDRDRPRTRARYDDEPRRRRYEDDDRPRRRRRNEDDFDDRPRSSGGGAKTALIVLLIVAIIVAVIAAIAWRFAEDEDADIPHQAFAPGVDTEMITLAPDDAVVLAGIDMRQLRNQPRFARMIGNIFTTRLPDKHGFERRLSDAGLSEQDVDGILISMSAPGGSGPVIVIRFNHDLDRDRIVRKFGAIKHTDDFKRYYISGADRCAFFFAGKRMIVIADDRTTLKKLLHHDRTQLQLPEDMHALAGKTGGQYWMVMKKDGGMDAMKQFAGGFGAEDLFAGFADQTDSLTVTLSAQNDSLECELGLKMKGDKNAADAKRQMQDEVAAARRLGNLAPNLRDMPADERAVAQAVIQTATFRNDGSIAFMKYKVNLGLFERMMQMQQNGGMNRPRFGP